MTVPSHAATGQAADHRPLPRMEYRPGVCNIGREEIDRRRRAGHVGLVLSVLIFGALVVVDAPPPMRLILAVPVALAASGYLQARLKFCAGFGWRGVFNFGALGTTHDVADPEARRRDRLRARQIGLASVAIGVVVALLTVALAL